MLQAWRVVNPDFTSSRGFRWPFPGGEVELPTPNGGFTRGNPCPQFEGDGVCLAKTFKGAASGGIRAVTGLVVEYAPDDVLGEDDDKLRVSRCRVTDVFDVQAVIRAGFCKNLSGSDLSYSDLRYSNLRYSNLRYSNLYGSNLRGSDLYGSDLRGSDLRYSDLRYSNLRGSDLRYSNLRGSNLRGSDLYGSDLRGSDLRYSDLRGSNLRGAFADEFTRWPLGFDWKAAEVR